MHINYGEILPTQIERKARQKTLSMPFPVLIRKLCAHAHVRFFSFDVALCTTRVIDVDRRRDVEALRAKKRNMQVLGGHSFSQATLEELNTVEPTSTNQSSYHTFVDMVYSNDHQLKKLAKSLPDVLMAAAEKAIKGLAYSVDKLCKRVDVVEGAVITLKSDMHELKGKAQMDDTDMAMPTKAMKASKNTLGPIDALMR